MKTPVAILNRLVPIAVCFCLAGPLSATDKKIVLIAGTPSHGPGEHEFNAGVLLLKKCLDKVNGLKAQTHLNGWPKEPKAFEGADAVVIFCDGGGAHLALGDNHLKELGMLMKKGVGLACIHYAVEVPKDKGGQEFLQWIGGYFETHWSVNPTWEADFNQMPKHAITRGVKPFKIYDEWYFHMRFPEGMKNVTPGDPSRAIRLEAAVTQGEVWKSALPRRFVSLRLAVHRRFIRAFEGRLGSRTLRALSTPATGSLPASIKPSCTSTEA
jgi:hypothetical protein